MWVLSQIRLTQKFMFQTRTPLLRCRRSAPDAELEECSLLCTIWCVLGFFLRVWAQSFLQTRRPNPHSIQLEIACYFPPRGVAGSG